MTVEVGWAKLLSAVVYVVDDTTDRPHLGKLEMVVRAPKWRGRADP